MKWEVGDRVELVCCNDPWTNLAPGTRGTVSFIDDTGTVFVDWDDGHRLGMIAEAGDRIIPAGPERPVPNVDGSRWSRGHP